MIERGGDPGAGRPVVESAWRPLAVVTSAKWRWLPQPVGHHIARDPPGKGRRCGRLPRYGDAVAETTFSRDTIVGLVVLLMVGLAALVPGLSMGWNWVSGHGATSTTGILFLIILIFGGSVAAAYACRGLWSCCRPSRD